MNTKEDAEKRYREQHFLLKCPFCGHELVVTQSELQREMFEPKEEEVEHYEYVFDEETGNIISIETKTKKELVSSDSSKDIYKDIKCCYCGHVWNEQIVNMYDKRCNPDGKKTRVFELTESETKAAEEFRKEHSHKEEFKKQGKMGFSTLGMQFTYTITPGGLGPLVSIKCNHCGETKDITDSDNW